MDWLNLHTSMLDSAEFIGSDTRERGTWLSLLRYCIGQENGGRIENCKGWKDRKWQQLARVTLREVTGPCALFEWDASALVIKGYPFEKEKEVKSKREIAKFNGRKGGRPLMITNVGSQKKPTLVNSPKAEGEGEGEREGEGESQPRGEGREGVVEAGVFEAQLAALATATEGTLTTLSKRAARNVDASLREIRQLCPNLTPDEIARRASNFRAHFRTAGLTAQALANHWSRCDTPPPDAPKAKQLETDMPHAELMRRHGGTF